MSWTKWHLEVRHSAFIFWRETLMLCAYIMAGGSGDRFWPLSSQEKPKQLLKLFSEKSMIRETVDRILPLIPAEMIFIGTNVKQSKEIIKELPMISEENVVIEPAFKDTAAAIGYGALYIRNRVKDALIVVLASDHLIQRPDDFRNIIKIASEEAISNDTIVTLGIRADYAETGYGYIETDKNISNGKVYPVKRFWEKPNRERAEEYLTEGNYLWNSGMFIFKAEAILQEIERYMPRHHLILQEINKEIEAGHVKTELTLRILHYFEKFEKISIDFGILEHSSKIKVIPSDFGWNDIGSFSVLDRVFKADSNGNVIRNTSEKLIESSNNIIISDNFEVGVIGVSNLIVVQTEGKLLICHRDRAQEVKKLK
jgi:mannose-1-phosphate guanylyltransferase